MLKAILFDLDQTLIDWDQVEPWETYHYRTIQPVFDQACADFHALRDTGMEVFRECYINELTDAWQRGKETLIAPHIGTVLVEALKCCGVPAAHIDPEAVIQAYDWQCPPGTQAFPDVLEVLPQIKMHGIELGIVTNASHPMYLRDRELRAFGILDLFSDCRVSAADVGYIKPHRTIFERALNWLNISAAEAVFVGDNLQADIQGANNVGIRSVWRVTAHASDNAETDIVPTGSITTLHDLLPLLDDWYPGWRNGHAG